MKKITTTLSILALLAAVMTSCLTPSPEPTFVETDLLGLWGKGDATMSDSVPMQFIRFTAEQDEMTEYKYGREWDESEDIFESDLKPYGNGWFKYKLVQNELTEIHLMDNGGAVIPKVYVVLKLNEYELTYQDDFGKTHYYYKCGEK